MSNKKPLSHFNRLNSPTAPCVTISHDERFKFTKTTEYSEDLQRMVDTTKKVAVKNSPYEHLRPSDFALENILATGASIQPCSLRMSQHETLSMVEQGLSNLSKNLDNGK